MSHVGSEKGREEEGLTFVLLRLVANGGLLTLRRRHGEPVNIGEPDDVGYQNAGKEWTSVSALFSATLSGTQLPGWGQRVGVDMTHTEPQVNVPSKTIRCRRGTAHTID